MATTSPYASFAQAGILGMPQTDLGVLGASLKDAMAYFSGHPDQAGALLPALQQSQQMNYMRGLLAPATSKIAQGAPLSAPNLAGPAPDGSVQKPAAAYSPQALAQRQPELAGSSAPAQGADYGDLNPQAQAVYDQLPHIPGMPARQALNFYLTDPGSYLTTAAKQYDMTDLVKNANAAYGANSPQAQGVIRGTLNKGAAVNLRPGGGALNYADNSIITMPGANGVQTVFPQGANGPAQMQMVPGAAPALAASSYSTNAGKAATTPDIGYDSNGNPVATNNLAMTGAGNPLGLPGQGANVGPRGAALPRPGQPGGSSLMPALPANQAPFMAGQGKEAADRHAQTINEALGSPDRVNVLDNIIGLSQSGVATGPGQQWQNNALGTLANLPGLSKVMGGAKDNVAKFQELQKFLQQNGQRAWQVAGGTGTDKQLEAAMHAQPNDAQFPQALQTVAKWVKAGEMAVQAKANAQDRYLQQNGNTATNQTAFENQWRNAMDRRAFQLQTMAPQEQAAYIKSLSPRDAATLRQKRLQLMQMGALQ